MAGHSKWANIKHKKERADRAKGKVFSNLIKEIISAVKLGGPDPKSNSRLRFAVQKAKEANMPSENIERNIKKASEKDSSNYECIIYEMYGYGGIGLMIEAITDNKNRTASDMRIATNKKGGNMAQPGSVAFSFSRKGVIQIKKEKEDEERILNLAIESGAENFEISEDRYIIITDPAELYAVREKLEGISTIITEVNIEMIPKMRIRCQPEDQRANLSLIQWLEEIEEVHAVYHNMDL
ncbi:MAG: YebC/PmpR family DNA-binding transcriptional regulator [Chlamydiales bacterium]